MSIQEHLNKIRNAIYGREVRESIAKGIETAYDDASEKDNANMEVKIARGTHPNLRSRLEEVDNKQQQTTAQLAQTVKVGGGGQVTSDMLSQEVKEQMTGGSVSVVGENSVDLGNLNPRLKQYFPVDTQSIVFEVGGASGSGVDRTDDMRARNTMETNVYLSPGMIVEMEPPYQFLAYRFDGDGNFIDRPFGGSFSDALPVQTISLPGFYRFLITAEPEIDFSADESALSRINTSLSITNPLSQDSLAKSIENLSIGGNGNYTGKHLSILGDSISTFEGYNPPENAVWYTGSKGDVNTVDKTWWKRLLDQTGMELCVNNSWSNARVSGTGESSGIQRADDLHTPTQEPDVIVIYLGINDFNNGVDIGEYDGTQLFPNSTSTFREAYAVMLDKIMTRYPHAKTYVCTLPEAERNDPLTFPEINENGVLLADWNNAIREMADLFGSEIIELSKAGITFHNKSLYTIDELHPNSAGQRLLGNKALSTIEPTATFSTL